MNRHPAVSAFGRRLQGLRHAAGYTQEELATISGLSVNAISSLERGERRWPQPETVRALAAALDLPEAARAELLASARRGRPAQTGAPGVRVPHPPHPLVGRKAELKALRSALRASSTRLVTITGPGGVGKTRLATEAALGIESEGLCWVTFAELAPLGHPALVAGAIADALGMGEVPAGVLPGSVAALVRHRPTLLVLDNFEHVIDAASLVSDILAAAPELRVLATSRAPLRVRGEHERPLAPLERSAAELLFLERIRQVRPDYRPGRREAKALAAICARLDALPLALELSAAWLRLLTPLEVLARLETGAPLPSLPHRDAVQRHRSMAAAVGWSYALLGEEDRRFFRRLAILPGGCDLAMATAVALDGGDGAEDRALGSLSRLIEQSLLLRERAAGGGARYRMLETVRAHAAELLAASSDGPSAAAGLAARCLGLAAAASTALFGPDQVAWLDLLDADLGNIRAALDQLLERGDHADAARILGGTALFWMVRSHVSEGLDWCERVLARPGLLSESVHARLLNAAAMMAIARHHTDRAARFLERGLPLAESADDVDALAMGLHLRGFTSIAREDVPGATVSFERSRALFRDRVAWGEGLNLIGLGHARLLAGDLAGAERMLREAQTALHEAGSWWSWGSTFSYLGLVSLLQGRPDESIALTLEGIARLEGHRDRFDLVFALVYLACACVDRGSDLTAARLLGALDAVMETTGFGIVDPATRKLRDHYEGILRSRSDPRRLERARAAGRETPLSRLRRDLEREVGNSRRGPSSPG